MCFNNSRNCSRCGGNSPVFVIRNNNRSNRCGIFNNCYGWSGWNNCCNWSGWNNNCNWLGFNNCNRCGCSWNNGCNYIMPVNNNSDFFVNRYTGYVFSDCNSSFGGC